MSIMYKSIIKFLGRFLLAYCLIFSNLIYAAPISPCASCIPATKSDAFSLTGSQLGLLGPFAFGISRDSLFKYSGNAQYTQKFSNNFAASGIVEFGQNTSRLNGTIGFNLSKHGLFKFTAEYLSQVLPFTFDSGAVNQRMAQNAYGATYQYAFDNKFIRDISIGGFYADTPNKSLDSLAFIYNGASAINDRNIAGGTSKSVNVGSDLLLTNRTMLTGHLYYDDLHYKTIYTASSPYNSSRMGGSLAVNQLIGDHLKLSAEGSLRALYDSYKVGISWLPKTTANIGFEVSLIGQRSISHNQTPNSNSIGLQFNFNPTVGNTHAKYQLVIPYATNDITAWTSVPAVHMDRVLAVADQRTRILVPTLTGISPTSGPIAGGTKVIITGTNFMGATAVNFGSAAATNFTVISNTEISATTPAGTGVVDVTVTTPGGTTATSAGDQFTYSLLTITASAGANGSITPSGATLVNYGSNQTYTITPAATYYIANVLVDGVSVGAVSTYTFTNVTTAHTITASFSLSTNIITSNAGANGSILHLEQRQ